MDKISTKINEGKIKSNLAKIKKLRAIIACNEPAEAEKNQKQKINILNTKPEQENPNRKQKQEQENEANLGEEQQENFENSNGVNEKNNNNNDNISNINDKLVPENINSINLNNNTCENPNYEGEADDPSNESNYNENQTEIEIQKIQKQIFDQKKKTAAELLSELYDLIQIDDQKAYESKMKGFVLPFRSNKVNLE